MPASTMNARLSLLTLLLVSACSQSPEAEPADSNAAESGVAADPADVATEVKAAVNAHWTAISDGDTAAIRSHHTTDMTFFGPESDQLVSFASNGPEMAALRQKFLGAKATWTPRDVRVQVFHDVAIATFLADGSTTNADGKVDRRTRRMTEVWARQADGSWKEAHHHDSPVGN